MIVMAVPVRHRLTQRKNAYAASQRLMDGASIRGSTACPCRIAARKMSNMRLHSTNAYFWCHLTTLQYETNCRRQAI